MRLDISNLLTALLVVHEVRAGPLRPMRYAPPRRLGSREDVVNTEDRHRRREENFPECQPEKHGGGFGGGGFFGEIRDPQASVLSYVPPTEKRTQSDPPSRNPDPTPSPEICILPSAESSDAEDTTEVPSTAKPNETATGAREGISDTAGGLEEPTQAPESTVDKTSPAQTNGSPVVPTEEPSSGAVSETSTSDRASEEPTDAPKGTAGETAPAQTKSSPAEPTEDPSSGVGSETPTEGRVTETPSNSEESTATGPGSASGDPASAAESETGAEASGTLAGTSPGPTKTVTVTVTPEDDKTTGTADEETGSATASDGAASSGDPGEPGLTSAVSSSVDDPSPTESPIEGTDANTDEPPSPTGVVTDTDPGAVPSATEGRGASTDVASSAVGSETGTDATSTATGAQPSPSEVPPDNSTELTITPTGTVNMEVPTEVRMRPTSTATVPADVMERNIERAKELNELYSSLTRLSACKEGQIACVDGGVARCRAGAFSVEGCAAGMTCYALPMRTVRGTQIKCATEEEAAASLGQDGVPSQEPSGSASAAPGESPSEIASEAPSASATQAPGDGASEPPRESTQAPSQPAGGSTTTVTQQSTVTITSVVTPTKQLTFSSIITGGRLVSSSREQEPGETPAQSTEVGAVIPTTLGQSEPAEAGAPSPTREEPFPSNPIQIIPIKLEEGETSPTPEPPLQDLPVNHPVEVPISFRVPFGPATTVPVTVTVSAVETETVTETVTVGA